MWLSILNFLLLLVMVIGTLTLVFSPYVWNDCYTVGKGD